MKTSILVTMEYLIPRGSPVELKWESTKLYAHFEGFPIPLPIEGKILTIFKGFQSWPTQEEIQEWISSSIVPTIDHQNNGRYDGVDENGMPSWLLYLGYV